VGKETAVQLEDYFEFLGPNEIKIKGHRIWIEHVLYEYLYREMSVEELAERFDTLTLEQIHAVLLYYLQNKEAMDRYMADWLEYCRTSREEDMKKRPEFYEKLQRLLAEHDAKPQRSA
jgi:uncharacterized protein (DUF433 family)